MRILIVEDDPALASAYVRMLKRREHVVDWTPRVDEARAFLRDFPYDVLLLDREVSARDGWRLRDEVDALRPPTAPRPRSVLMTGNPRWDDDRRAHYVKGVDSLARLLELVEGRG